MPQNGVHTNSFNVASSAVLKNGHTTLLGTQKSPVISSCYGYNLSGINTIKPTGKNKGGITGNNW